jgi:dipeptidyl aminopeptidase/acylaminoacyl peptidase
MSDHDTWRGRFRVPITRGAHLAPSHPTRGIVLSNRASDVVQACAWDVAAGTITPRTDLPAGLRSAWIDPDGAWIYYLHDDRGNELGHVSRIPWEGGDAVDLTPELEPYVVTGLAVSRDGRRLAFVAAARTGFDLYVGGQPAEGATFDGRSVFHVSGLTMGPWLSADGRLAVVATTEFSKSMDMDLVAIDTTTGEQVGSWIDESVNLEPAAFSPIDGDQRLLLSTTSGGLSHPVVWDPTTDECVELTSELDGEVFPRDWRPDAGAVVLVQIDGAVTQVHVWDPTTGEVVLVPHPPGHVGAVSYTGEARLLVEIEDGTSPNHITDIDPASGDSRTLLGPTSFPPGRAWRSVSFTSSDDATIQAWLAEPDGDGPHPTILETHGGPTAAQFDQWAPMAQAWLDHGYAVMSVNYRGSTTFGHEFEASIRGELGRREVDDVVAARRWLVDNGVADPDLVFLTGWSYGGYLTLHTPGMAPGLWAGGMAGIAIADWTLMYEDMAETLRQYAVALFGGGPDDVPDLYRASSPITYAERVDTPLLVFQGSNDTRCPARQLRVYEERLRELGKPIEVEWFDAGHGSLDVEQQISFQQQMLDFADAIVAERTTARA